MVKMQTWEQARGRRQTFRKDTFEGSITDIISTSQVRQSGEQAFLVEQDPLWTTPTHYHVEHQFQVIIAGSGTIGRHKVSRLCVHYAAPETAYGPIVAGNEGVSYLTMRLSGDSGAWYIHKPGSRERMQPGLKREQFHATPQGSIDAQQLAAMRGVALEALIAPRTDGLAAHLVRMGPGQSHTHVAEHRHGGRFYVVTQGAVDIDGATALPLTVAHARAQEQPHLLAGPAGAELLVLQFPVQALAADHA